MENTEIRKETIDKVSIKTGYKRSDVKKILDTSFEFVAHTIKKGNFEGVRLPYFGIFKAKEYRIFALNNPEKVELNNLYKHNKKTNVSKEQNQINES